MSLLIELEENIISNCFSLDPSKKESKIRYQEEKIEVTPKQFFDLTYITSTLKELFINLNQNLLGINMNRSIILSAKHGTGKTHALLALYNLFQAPEVAEDYLKENKIKLNKFTITEIKNNSQSCILDLSKEKTDKIWEVIFNKLDKKDILKNIYGYPEVDEIRELINNKYTLILIDGLKEYFDSIDDEREDYLLEANKIFLTTLLKEAKENDKLIIGLGTLEDNQIIADINNELEIRVKNMNNLDECREIIFNRLFKNKKTKRKEIKEVIDKYLEEYQRIGFSFKNIEQVRENFINSYPFHPQLLNYIIKSYQKYCTYLPKPMNHIKILAKLVKENYQDKELILLSDLNTKLFEKINIGITEAFQENLLDCVDKGEYCSDILKIIFLVQISEDRFVSQEEILQGLVMPDKNNAKAIEENLKRVINHSSQLITENLKYKIKVDKDIITLINEKLPKMDRRKAQNKLLSFFRENFVDFDYKIYNFDQIKDDSDFKVVLLLTPPESKKELIKEIKNKIYNRNFKNNLLIIKADKSICTPENINTIKKINLLDQLKEGENNFFNSEVELFRDLLEDQLRKSLENLKYSYLIWTQVQGKIDLVEKKIESLNINLKEEIEADFTTIEKYIKRKLNERKKITVEELLLETKKNIFNPIIIQDQTFYNVIKKLSIKDEIYISKNNEVYNKSKELLLKYILSILEQKCSLAIQDLIYRIEENIELNFKVDQQELYDLLIALHKGQKIFFDKNNNCIYKDNSVLIQEKVAEINNKEARKELFDYIKEELFDIEIQIYGHDQIKDNKKVKVLLLDISHKLVASNLEKYANNSLLYRRELEFFLNDKIYKKLKYKNTLAIIKPKEDLFSVEIINLIKEIIAIRNSDSIRKESGVLNEKKRILNNLLQNINWLYLKWEQDTKGIKLKQEKISIDNILEEIKPDFNLAKGLVKAEIDNRGDKIYTEELLEGFKQDRSKIFLIEDEFFDALIDELRVENYLFTASNNKLIYKDIRTLIKDQLREVDDNIAKERLIALISKDLFGQEFKVYSYHQLEDKNDLEYVILLNDLYSDDRLKEFLEDNIYHGRKFQNTLVIIKANENILVEENIILMKKILLLEELKANIGIRTKLKEKKKQLLHNLRSSFGVYLRWFAKDGEVKLSKEDLEYESFNLSQMIKSDRLLLKEFILREIKGKTAGVLIEKLLSCCKSYRHNPFISDDIIFYQVIEQLYDSSKITLKDKNSKVYYEEKIIINKDMVLLDSNINFDNQKAN
ncbi:hypothetical protein [Orenia marismortui]|uniref:hypothetical protein n=1 Tax=Orenia marismortui TaxID=46469 RepID=UPI000367BF89|nr:hypothetical protein [Orenia marismortui]